MRRRGVLAAAGAAGTGLLLAPWPLSRAAGEARDAGWLPVRDVDLTVAGHGNALDLSRLVPAGPAGQQGWAKASGQGIGFERAPAPQRFFCANIVFSPPNGGAPEHGDARRVVAELRATGYRAIRLQFIDAYLMQGRVRDFDFDPKSLDRVHFFLAELKSAGICWIVDGMSSDNAAYGDVGPNRYARKHDARLEALTGDAGFEHWARLVDGIWGVVNPYTRSTTLRDPALLGMVLVNEGGVAFLSRTSGGRYADALAAPFSAWLQKRYGSREALSSAWGGGLSAEESSGRPIRQPAQIRGRSPRDLDFARFVAATEVAGFKRMDAHVRAAGFGGLTTAFNNAVTYGADLARAQLPWIDMHAYQNLPTKYAEPGSSVAQGSIFDDLARALRSFSSARQWGKPFSASEYGQQFWNGRRYEMGPLLAAMAMHQGWSLVSQFAETPVQFDYSLTGPPRRRALYPNGIAADPVQRCVERLVAFLYARGDVAASAHRIRLHVDEGDVFGRGLAGEHIPEAVSRLAFIAPMGLDFGPVPPKPVAGEVSIDLGAWRSGTGGKIEDALRRQGFAFGDDLLEPLRRAGVIGSANLSAPARQLYQSDTGEIVIDGARRRYTVVTPRTCVLTIDETAASVAAGPLSVQETSGPALFAVAAVDEEPLVRSRHLLVWVLTDARNTGMSFRDAESTVLDRLGSFPPVVRTLGCTLSLQLSSPASLKVWALGLDGQRRGELQTRVREGALVVALDTSALAGGPALMFEIAAA